MNLWLVFHFFVAWTCCIWQVKTILQDVKWDSSTNSSFSCSILAGECGLELLWRRTILSDCMLDVLAFKAFQKFDVLSFKMLHHPSVSMFFCSTKQLLTGTHCSILKGSNKFSIPYSLQLVHVWSPSCVPCLFLLLQFFSGLASLFPTCPSQGCWY